MIKVDYFYDDDFRMKGFSVKGHAEYAEYGKDIVCAAVTTHAVGVINSLDVLQKVEFERIIAEEGHIECCVKDKDIEKSQLLLEHFKLAINEIKREYPKNIKILKNRG